MREVLDELTGWWHAGATVGMATVVGTWRSSPRPAGAVMLVGPDGTAVGSVSGGCVEGDVYDLATEAVSTGAPVLRRYGVSDDDAFAVGLTCGGIIDVFVEPAATSPSSGRMPGRPAIRTGTPVAVVTCVAAGDDDPESRPGRRLIVRAGRTEGSLGSPRLDAAATDGARGLLAAGRSGSLR